MLSWAASSASRRSAGIAVERRGHLGRRHPQVVEPHAVEALGEAPQRLVAVLADLGQQRPHLVDGRFGLGRGPGQPPTQVVGAGPAQVESAEHDRQRYPGPGRRPHRDCRRTAEVSRPRAGIEPCHGERSRRAVGAGDHPRRPHGPRSPRPPTATGLAPRTTWPTASTRSSGRCSPAAASSSGCCARCADDRTPQRCHDPVAIAHCPGHDDGAPKGAVAATSGGGSRRRLEPGGGNLVVIHVIAYGVGRGCAPSEELRCGSFTIRFDDTQTARQQASEA